MNDNVQEIGQNTQLQTEIVCDNPLTLIEWIRDEVYNPRDLVIHQRRGIVREMLTQGATQSVIARFLNIPRQYVYADVKAMRREFSNKAQSLDWTKASGRLMHSASMCSEMAHKNKDYKEVWRIECDLVDRLQKMGLIPEAPKKLELNEIAGTRDELIAKIVGTITRVDAHVELVRRRKSDNPLS